MLGILGLDPLDPHRDQRADTTDTVHHALDVLVTEQLQQRGATPCHSAKVFVSQS